MPDSIKLCVTVRSALADKYPKTALQKIDAAIAAWIAAEKVRGIKTVHVALDVAGDTKPHGVEALEGKVTAPRAKKAIDALAKKLGPDYIVILGGDDVVPYFHVPNPDLAADDEPVEHDVPTDNPYATSRPYVAKSLKSYMVPDRVVGRIPDLPAAKGKGDPTTIVAALKSATQWTPKPKSYFADVYATCTATWKEAGVATMRYLEYPPGDLMISPTTIDTASTARKRLARKVHFTKCHGADLDAHFFGETLANPSKYPEVLVSGTASAHVKPGTLAAAMCCYGANVYSPSAALAAPAGAFPIPVAYLHAGALAFMGSTRIAYVGNKTMECADWIVAAYIKKALGGASLGRAMLEAKQDFMQGLVNQGQNPETSDEKTMIEFVLLGDPAIHPISSTVPLARRTGPVAIERRAANRAERRIARAVVGAQVQKALPTRVAAAAPSADHARKIFKAASGLLSKADLGSMNPAHARASCLRPAPYREEMTKKAGLVSRAAMRESTAQTMEYTWSSRKKATVGPVKIVLLKVQTDAEGTVLRTRTLYSA